MNPEKMQKEISTVLDETENMEWQISVYVDIMQSIETENTIKPFTRCAYENYYGMVQAHLKKEWREKYFKYADKCLKNNKKPTFSEAMKEIGKYGNDKMQPSFVSKLVHSINKTEPIYDSKVKIFLEKEEPQGEKVEERIKSAIRIYEEIWDFYNNNEYAVLRKQMLKVFDEKFPLAKRISETKKIDFVIWALGKKRRKLSELVE